MSFIKLNWKEVLVPDYKRFGHIDDFFKVVLASGYPFFIWSDRVFMVSDKGYVESEIFKIRDIK